MGSSFAKKKLGTFGLASSHSLYYGHHISTIEGGLVSTSDRELYNTFLAIRSHGWARDMQKKFRARLEKKYKIRKIYNSRNNEKAFEEIFQDTFKYFI